MTAKKYIKKTIKYAKKTAKKRYTTRTGGARVNKLASDILFIKRQLNVEHKHYDYQWGSGKAVTALTPTKTTPIILALGTPVKGISFNQRIGNQFKITHITVKLQVVFKNNSDLIQRTGMIFQLLFAKSADDVPDITKLYDQDSNGHYTSMSFANTQEFGKYHWIKGLTCQKSYTQPTNRFPNSNDSGVTRISSVDGTFSASNPVATSLNDATFYINKMVEVSIPVLFKNNSEDIEQMKPYILLRSDVIEANPIDYDPISVTGQIRFTYVDN